MEITEDQKAGSSTPFSELRESYHPFIHTHRAREQGLGQTLCRGPIQPELLHESINKRVTEYEQVFQTLQSSKYSWSQPPGIPNTDMETHTVNLSQRRKTGLVRHLSRKSNNHRENKSKKNGCILHLSPLILKKCNSSVQMSTGEKTELHCGFYSNISHFFDANCALLTLSLHRFSV